MANKRGVSTVEIIVSFTIFLAFILFIFAYLNPLKKDITSPLLSTLEGGLKTNAMTELTELPIVIQNPPACISISNPFDISERQKGNFSVKDAEGNVLGHNTDASKNTIYFKGTSDKFYTIMLSDEIDAVNSLDCSNPVNAAYTESVARTKKVYSYKKMVAINNSYYNPQGYTQLKQKFNFPITSDFSIIITNNEINISMRRNIPSGSQVRVRNYPIEVLKNDEKKPATLSLIVWT